MPVGDCCVGWRVGTAVGGYSNTILHLSELETGGVRLLGHQITRPPEQRRVVLLVNHKSEIFNIESTTVIKNLVNSINGVARILVWGASVFIAVGCSHVTL